MNLRTCIMILCLSAFSLPCMVSGVSALEVIELPKATGGVVYFRVMVKAGSQHDPEGKEGLASAVATMLERGSGKLSRQRFTERLDELAVDLTTHVQKEFTMIVARSLSTVVADFYPLLVDMITAPTFDESQLARTQDDMLEGLQQIKNSNEDLGLEAFGHFVYAGTRWQHASYGRTSTVPKLTRQELLDFYGSHYRQDNLIVGIAGDYSKVTLVSREQPEKQLGLADKLREDLKRLPAGAPQPINSIGPIGPPRPNFKGSGPRVWIVEKPGLEQGQINIGHPISATRNDRDYPALYLAIQALGEHRTFTGELMQSIRADRGLTYGAYAYMEYFPYPYQTGANVLPMPNIARSQQDFRIWTFTLIENIPFTLRLALLKWSEFMQEEMPMARFQKLKSAAINQFIFHTEALDRRLAMQLDDRIYGTGNFAADFEKRLRAVASPASIKQAMQRHLNRSEIAIVLTTADGKKLQESLLAGDTKVEYQGAIDPKPLAIEDAKVRKYPLTLKPNDIQIITADQLFE